MLANKNGKVVQNCEFDTQTHLDNFFEACSQFDLIDFGKFNNKREERKKSNSDTKTGSNSLAVDDSLLKP